ncbi:MAG TPA: hypothetical protein VF395_16645 [Polyangiaceae bacterium]
MFGPIFGAACVIGLGLMFARRRRYWHGEHGHFGHHGHGHHFGGRRGGRWFGLRRVLERLDTTPGQEKAILGAIDDLRDHATTAREGLRETRQDVANALREETLDQHSFASLFDRHLAELEALRDDAARAAATIHETLTAKQRARLADLVETGRPFRHTHAL